MPSEPRAPLGLTLAATGGLLFLHLPILVIFIYASPPSSAPMPFRHPA